MCGELRLPRHASPGGISANWIYYMEQAIRGLGADAVVVFLQGACGDVTQVDNLSPSADLAGERGPVGGRARGGRGGQGAADDGAGRSCRSLSRPEPSTQTPRAATRTSAEMPASRFARAIGRPTDWTFAKNRSSRRTDPESRRPTWRFRRCRLGRLYLRQIRQSIFWSWAWESNGQPFPLTFPVEMANGVGYVPTEECSAAGGGYETRLTAYSNLEPTAGTKIMDTCIHLTRELTPGEVPSRPMPVHGAAAPGVTAASRLS